MMSKLLCTRFTKLIINHFLSTNKSIPRRSSSKLHSSQDDQPITKFSNTVKSDYKFGIEIPDTMISDAIKKLAGYKFYIAKKVESENAKIIDEPEEQHVSPVKSGRGKGFICYVAVTYAEWGQKLKGLIVDDPAVQSLLDLRKGSKASRLESLKQKKQAVVGEGLNKTEESESETDDVDDSDMDLSNDNPHEDDDAAGYGTLLDETLANELTDFMSHPVYTNAQTTTMVHNLEGNPEITSYLSRASEVPLGTHVDVLATKTLLYEMFLDENAHHLSSPPATKTSYPTIYPQPSSLQAKAKKLMQKAKHNMRKINFKKAVAQKFREYDQKLEALTNFNVFEAFEKGVQAKF
nr:hypothetical protein [Tanacetum cinerariifolium]